MAASVIPFPQTPGQDLPEIENLIRNCLVEISANHDLIESVTGRMMDFIEKYASQSFEPTFNLPVPPGFSKEDAEALRCSIEKGVDNTAEQVQEMINKIVMERFLLEIEIYENRAKAGKPRLSKV